ncbi:hypothetical protein CMV30_11035 [Nibricoccus aquaticus]|uniref:DUF1800 domain-containing protein n=1 Tax=Nibricoccus aquaticus TaxID=2576891 RepID=A0A290Q7G8_9BACT|nr:DUF1800 family protein [Nibricoccus aquaticus]ATC64444.1 hypothetical protein CMV30_11035 [Nibricoccus aquaticus]
MCPVNLRAKLARASLFAAFGALLFPATASAILDRDANQLSDIWQLQYGTGNVSAAADTDRDGFTNLEESAAGTNPLDPNSRPVMNMQSGAGQVQIKWVNPGDKQYTVLTSPTLGAGAVWTTAGIYTGGAGQMTAAFNAGSTSGGFFRVQIDDLDTDGDGLFDWDERRLGLDPTRKNTDGYGSTTITDFYRANQALLLATDANATNDNSVTVAALDPYMSENWADPGVIVFRRSGGTNALPLTAITVNYTIGGTATAGTDYQGPASGTVAFGLGVSEVLMNFTPVADADVEGSETITVTLQTGTGYILGTALAGAPSATVATINLADATGGAISDEEAARFLAQATFGPTEGEITRVKQLGFSGWIDDQFTRAANYHLPLVHTWQAEYQALATPANATSSDRTEVWWRRAMATDGASDPLRQRVAHAISQICIISDRVETLDGSPRGMAAYHDKLLENTFGNYRDLLKAVSLHPTMGIYLSHLRNQKANPSRNIYPDENYAREIMQLFSIGLWELNPDGTRKLDGNGQAIPTYDNEDISNFARVFTGLSYSKKFTSSTNFTVIDTVGFTDGNALMWEPMKGFDAYHDLAAKTLLNGLVLPARTASPGGTGTATMLDVDAAMTNLTNHNNTGPFIARLLIQRLVTSNPTNAYIGRVAAAFANNGSGVRGDMRAVIKAILLDTEARSLSLLTEPDQGLQREPYLRYAALTRALGTVPADGRYRGFRNIDGDFLQRPYSSPSVFNFYSPDYQPLGVLKNAGLVGPEFQITNGVTGITSPNRFYNSIHNTTLLRMNVSAATNIDGTANTTLDCVIDTAPWIDDATSNPESLVARLDRILAAGQLSTNTLRIITKAVRRIDDPLGTTDPTTRTTRAINRLRMAAYLVAISPEACVLK